MRTDEAQARALAIADLRANPHHEAVEIWKDDEVLFAVSRADLVDDPMALAAQ
jgi:hypothetical protein